MASNENDPDAKYALSRLFIERGTMAEYQKEFEMLISQVTGKSESLLASIYTFGLKPALIRALLCNGCNDSETLGPETPAEEVVNNGIENEVVVGFSEEFQGDMVDALSEQRSLGNWKELDNESEDWKVERDSKREGEPTILATFGSDRGITIWDPEIKIVFKTPP
ncbi:hypothetical protein Tco_0140275 [Tanacetum coccineum]